MIKVYSTETCPYCHALMDWLDEQGIKYEAIDASTASDIDVVPVTIVGDQKIIGFDRPAITAALAKLTV